MFWNRTKTCSPMSIQSAQFDFMDRFFDGVFRNDPATAFPAFNVWANAEGAVVTGALPGVSMENLEITASGKTVVVKGARKEQESDARRYLKRERSEEAFSRAIELPFRIDADKVSATLTNGILEIALPRAESDKPRKIAVNVG